MIHLPIHIKLKPDAEAKRTQLKDISAKGIAVYSEVELSQTEPIEVIVSVPYEISLTAVLDIRISAEVVRVEEPEAESSHYTAALQFRDDLPESPITVSPEIDPRLMN